MEVPLEEGIGGLFVLMMEVNDIALREAQRAVTKAFSTSLITDVGVLVT